MSNYHNVAAPRDQELPASFSRLLILSELREQKHNSGTKKCSNAEMKSYKVIFYCQLRPRHHHIMTAT
jgi:hypothetical protein